MTYSFGKTSLEEIKHIWPDGRLVLHTAMSYQFMDFGLPEGAGPRTQQEQDYLYEQGRSRPGAIVTWTKKSKHIIDPQTGYGYAFDVVPFVNGKYVWDEKHCAVLATVILRAAAELRVPIDWGFHLWKKDMPHFQKRWIS